mmetsp:Transcript_26064/g.71814  ORF Transcript_26064/g.71814 Transcript_26064/m.71814 type:complete len:191 (-) Transcript_26064:2288-2860(-)|eukprot:scaffold35107_cov28-Tisochrysis_lutea.AAC.1
MRGVRGASSSLRMTANHYSNQSEVTRSLPNLHTAPSVEKEWQHYKTKHLKRLDDEEIGAKSNGIAEEESPHFRLAEEEGLDHHYKRAEDLQEEGAPPRENEARDAPPFFPAPFLPTIGQLALAQLSRKLHFLLLGHAVVDLRNYALALLALAPAMHAVTTVAPAEQKAREDGSGDAWENRNDSLNDDDIH